MSSRHLQITVTNTIRLDELQGIEDLMKQKLKGVRNDKFLIPLILQTLKDHRFDVSKINRDELNPENISITFKEDDL